MLDWLLGIGADLSSLVQELWAVLVFLFNLLVAVAQFLLNLIVSLAKFLLAALKAIAGFFHTLWDNFFKKIFLDVFNAIRKLHNWLELHLGPIIKAIRTYRAYLDRIFRLYIKPFLNLLQHVRQFLGILRLLGIKWAGALDARIGQIEASIAGIFLKVRGILTNTLDILNALADPLNLFRRPTIVLSIRRIIPTLFRVCTGYPIGFFFPSPRGNAQPGTGALPFPFALSDPVYNPAPSSYFTGDDGLGLFSGFTSGDIPDDGAVDDLDALAYFDDTAYPDPECTDLATCLARMVNTAGTSNLVTTG